MDSVKKWVGKHQALTAWFVLATGMVAILIFEARSVGLEGSQWFWLITLTVLVAGLCVWIINWGDDDEADDAIVE
jgi:hypothetical protein